MSAPNLDALLAAVPPACRNRLEVMGWPTAISEDPDRALRRAIGAAQPVSLVDLELDPERWHGGYVVTFGSVGWSQETTCLGRVWLNPQLALLASGRQATSFPPLFQARVSGIILADARLRAEHRLKHHSQGGYGRFGLFVAELVAASIDVEVSPSTRSARLAPSSKSRS